MTVFAWFEGGTDSANSARGSVVPVAAPERGGKSDYHHYYRTMLFKTSTIVIRIVERIESYPFNQIPIQLGGVPRLASWDPPTRTYSVNMHTKKDMPTIPIRRFKRL